MNEPQHDGPVCVVDGCKRPEGPGIRICTPHATRLGDWIARLADEYALLDAAPSMQGREPDTGGRSGLASQQSPAALDVLVLRDRRSRDRDLDDPDGNRGRGVLEVLESWARLVRDERGITPPTVALAYRRQAAPPGPVCDLNAPPCEHHTCWAWTFRTTVYAPATVLSERKILATHFDWIVQQDWCDELYTDVRALWQLLRGRNGSTAPRGLHRYDAPCPACGVRAITYRVGDAHALCQSCGTPADHHRAEAAA